MFGGGGDSSSNAARRTIVFGVCIGLSFILLLVAGLVTKNWLGMIMLLPLIMVPILIIVLEAMGVSGGGGASESPMKTALTNFGQCFFGTLLSCLIGLPAVLFHTESIDGLNFGLWLGATAVAMVGCVYYWSGRMSKDDF